MSKRIIEVIDYQPEWRFEFATEKERISSVLTAANIYAIHHIGSTSVEGLCAKPIIDILLEVNSLDTLDSESAKMASLGYLAKGEFGIKGRRYFQKGGIQRTHQVHAFLAGSPEVKRHIAFRDYLRAFPDVAFKYGEIKKAGALMCNNDIDVYIDYKNSFIKEHEAKALRWKSASKNHQYSD
ncbi:GrpB family protein [Vibrio sp. NFV-1]|uniref:GrpB family protein n=2 Tax=Vibrio nitrifigilis TaxID=2789781 RepID=A0ABS0GIU4_9VIBR|nr:GrpB family protein [Vibrio nitrifigilis]